MKLRKPPRNLAKLVGEFVGVKFDDHCLSSDQSGSIECVAFGQISKVDKKNLILRHWVCLNDPDQSNNEYVTIVRSTIIGLRVFK